MKKTIIVTAGIILIILVLVIWGYLLFFSTPKNSDEIFAKFGFGGTSTSTNQPVPTPAIPDSEQTTQLNNKPKALRQLTTKPVAGFTFVGSSTALVRYVERGTGHIFEINIDDNTERRISGTTIPRVVESKFSSDGTHVIYITESGYTRDNMLGTIDEEKSITNFTKLPPNSFDATFSSNTILNYALKTKTGTEGYKTDLNINNTTRIFSIPLRDISIVWDKSGAYAYNRPSISFKGSLYLIKGSKLNPVTPGEFSFVGGVSYSFYFDTAISGDFFKSYAINKISGEKLQLATTYLPEKCITLITNQTLSWCASPFESIPKKDLLKWYSGEIHMKDVLWLVDASAGKAQLASSFLKEAGRLIDVDKITVDSLGLIPIFRNKVDGTLWLYDSRLE